MNAHLNDEQIAAVVAGLEVEPWAVEHLRGCPACRNEVERMERLLEARRLEQREGEPDWSAQRESILNTVGPERRPRRTVRWLAAAAALVMAVGVGVVVHREGEQPGVKSVPVEQILADVDQTLGSDSIPGFEALEPLVPGPQDLESLNDNGTS